MGRDAVEPVGDRRAGGAAGLVIRPEHEVIDQELRAAPEEIRQAGAPLLGLEFVALLDPDPGQLLAPLRQRVALPGFALVVAANWIAYAKVGLPGAEQLRRRR